MAKQPKKSKAQSVELRSAILIVSIILNTVLLVAGLFVWVNYQKGNYAGSSLRAYIRNDKNCPTTKYFENNLCGLVGAGTQSLKEHNNKVPIHNQ